MRRQRMRRPDRGSAFTYGEEQLNPALYPSESRPAVWEDEEEYDVNSSALHVRRGSEGLEVRPPMYARMLQEDMPPRTAGPPATSHDMPIQDPSPIVVDVRTKKEGAMDEDEIPLGHLVRRHAPSAVPNT